MLLKMKIKQLIIRMLTKIQIKTKIPKIRMVHVQEQIVKIITKLVKITIVIKQLVH